LETILRLENLWPDGFELLDHQWAFSNPTVPPGPDTTAVLLRGQCIQLATPLCICLHRTGSVMRGFSKLWDKPIVSTPKSFHVVQKSPDNKPAVWQDIE
jgi:hypothetical protein